jgi:hypothetical protein
MRHPEEQLDLTDFDKLLDVLAVKYNMNYYLEGTPEHLKVKELFNIGCKEGFTKKEFWNCVDKFNKEYSYPTWQFSNVLDLTKRFELHSQSWYEQQLKEYSKESFVWYDIDGIPMCTFKNSPKLAFPLWEPKQPKVVPVKVEEWQINTELSETQKKVNRLLEKKQEELTSEEKTFLMRNKKPPLSDKMNEILEKIK